MDVEHWVLVAWERTKKDGVLSMAAREFRQFGEWL
jgi:hypothetical protein